MRRTFTAVLIAAALTLTTTPTEAMTEPIEPHSIAGVVTTLARANAKLERHVDWYERKIRKLKHKIAELQPEPAAPEPAAPVPASYSTTSSGSTHISEAAAAAAMRAAGFPESAISYFIAVIIPRESGFCPTAVYPGHCGDVSLFVPGGAACSLFQLYTCPGPQAADPYVAARYAYSKYQASGYAPWGG